MTLILLDACRPAGIRHRIYLSIVGVDRIPLGYHREKLPSRGCWHRREYRTRS